MNNKELILPQLDKLEKYHKRMVNIYESDVMIGFHSGWLNAIEQFRLMFEGVDVTVGLEVDDDS